MNVLVRKAIRHRTSSDLKDFQHKGNHQKRSTVFNKGIKKNVLIALVDKNFI